MKCGAYSMLLFLSVCLLANEAFSSFPVRDHHHLENASRELAVRVKSAKVLIGNYDLLREDFPHLNTVSDEGIDEWLINNAAYISESQSQPNEVNTPIFKDDLDRKAVYRPLGYGRAFVLPVQGGLIDVKGTGVRDGVIPANASHANGLMSLGEAIREFTMQGLVQQIFNHAKYFGYQSQQPLETVRSYAVIDWGFSIKDSFSTFKEMNHGSMRAGAIIRQAHSRKMVEGAGNHFLGKDEAIEVEMLLRQYGVTSSGNIVDGIDIPDVQGSCDLRLFDFGTYIVMDKFSNDLGSPLGAVDEESDDEEAPSENQYWRDFEQRMLSGERKGSFPEDSELHKYIEPRQTYQFIQQPNPSIAIPFGLWGHDRRINPKGRCHLDNVRHFGELCSVQINTRGSSDYQFIRYAVLQYLEYAFNTVHFKWFPKHFGRLVPLRCNKANH